MRSNDIQLAMTQVGAAATLRTHLRIRCVFHSHVGLCRLNSRLLTAQDVKKISLSTGEMMSDWSAVNKRCNLVSGAPEFGARQISVRADQRQAARDFAQ